MDEESYSDEMEILLIVAIYLNNFIIIFCDEMVPRIHEINGTGKMIYTTGCSLGATHAANMMLRRPDLFMGCIGLSGYYDTDLFFGQYVDENIYNNSPLKYLNGMSSNHPYVALYNKEKLFFVVDKVHGKMKWLNQQA